MAYYFFGVNNNENIVHKDSKEKETNAGSGEYTLPNSVRIDTSSSSSICIYTQSKMTPGGEWVANKPICSLSARAYSHLDPKESL